jgi:hypothetical protein
MIEELKAKADLLSIFYEIGRLIQPLSALWARDKPISILAIAVSILFTEATPNPLQLTAGIYSDTAVLLRTLMAGIRPLLWAGAIIRFERSFLMRPFGK